MRALWVAGLVLALAANGWLGNRLYQQHRQIDQGAAYLTWQSDHALNALAKILADPAIDWTNASLQVDLLSLLSRCKVSAEIAGSTMTGLTSGVQWRVMSQLNRLSFAMSDFESAARRLGTGIDPDGGRKRLQQLEGSLREAGWPRQPIARDSEEDWKALSIALETLLRLEGR